MAAMDTDDQKGRFALQNANVLGSGGYGLHNKVYTDSPMSRLLTKPPPAASPPQPTNGSKDEELAPSSTPARADKDEELQEIELQDDEL